MLKYQEEAAKLEDQLSPLCSSWTDACWDEIDWESRIREFQLRETLDLRKRQALTAQSATCLNCPNFVKHVCYYDGLLFCYTDT